MEIWAKSKGLTLREHTEHLLEAIERLPLEKLSFELLGIPNKTILERLLKYAAFFHDLGKVSPAFQKRIGNSNYSLQIPDFPNVRHNILSLFFINKEKVSKLCNGDPSLYVTFLSAIAFHHWKVDEMSYLLHINEDLIKASELLLQEHNGQKYGTLLAKFLENHFENFQHLDINGFILFDEDLAKHIKEKGNLISVDILPPYTLYFLPETLRLKTQLKINLNFWIFLSGFLIRADHFASFVEKKEAPHVYLKDIEKEAPKVRIIEKLKEKFRTDFWQKEAEKLKNKNLILIAPTGIGKTEFAFLWAEGEKFFYTLPLMVATNQIFERACEYFNDTESIPPSHYQSPEQTSEYFNDAESKITDPFINGNVGLLHSDADLYLLEKSENLKLDIEGETPKILDLARHFSLPVNICTGDQIFPAGLKYPQYEKIYATLGYSKLIIDEVQAYDPRACAIIVKMIEDIVSLGGKFLLITATLPAFVKNYLKEKGIITDEDIINCYEENNKIGVRINTKVKHKIELRCKEISEDIGEIIKKAKSGKRILVVLNTIEKAKEVYEKIKKLIPKEIFLDLLHSRFTLNQRRDKEKKLEEEFKNPKPEEEKAPKILVSTQVVEASLDIDADYIYTEIAPMDSLIQRMGRVMRRVDLLSNKLKDSGKEFIYENFYINSEPNIYIFYQEDKNSIIESGKGRVYPKDLLDKTLKILKEKVLNGILEEIRKQELVEEVYRDLENSLYIRKFNQTLSIINSGYVSENKEEAHRLFREIYTIPVVEEEYLVDIKNKIEEKMMRNEEITWLWFKKEIIAEYIINDYLWKYKNFEIEPLGKILKELLRIPEKIKRYCEGIWVYRTFSTNNINNIL
ncbi:MAG: CRISPR-associated helicase Cas3' [bacterium]